MSTGLTILLGFVIGYIANAVGSGRGERRAYKRVALWLLMVEQETRTAGTAAGVVETPGVQAVARRFNADFTRRVSSGERPAVEPSKPW